MYPLDRLFRLPWGLVVLEGHQQVGLDPGPMGEAADRQASSRSLSLVEEAGQEPHTVPIQEVQEGPHQLTPGRG